MVDDLDEKGVLLALLSGIWPHNPFVADLAQKTPATIQKFTDKAGEFINVEETIRAFTEHVE